MRDLGATSDTLTGLANRRQLETMLDIQLAEAARSGQPISCLMVDVDHFKRFHDMDFILNRDGSFQKTLAHKMAAATWRSLTRRGQRFESTAHRTRAFAPKSPFP